MCILNEWTWTAKQYPTFPYYVLRKYIYSNFVQQLINANSLSDVKAYYATHTHTHRHKMDNGGCSIRHTV